MSSDSSVTGARVVLLASFGSLHDAEAAARFLIDQGVPTKAIGLSQAAPNSRSSLADAPGFTRPLIFAAFGGVLTGLAGSILWSMFAPEVLTAGWRVIGLVFVGASAGGSIGLFVDDRLALPFPQNLAVPGPVASASNQGRAEELAVVAVAESHVDYAAGLLRRIGVDRMLFGHEPYA